MERKGFSLTRSKKIYGGNAIIEKAMKNSMATYDIWDRMKFDAANDTKLSTSKKEESDEQKNQNFSRLMKLDDDHVYYNIVITNTSTTDPILANFQEFRTEAIIKNPEDYHLSVIRFTIPTASIPLLIPSIQPGPSPYGSNPNKNVTNYSFTLSYFPDDGSKDPEDIVQEVIFESQDLDSPDPTRWDTVGVSQNVNYYSIYSYQQFIDMWNGALDNAFSSLSSPAQAYAQAPPKFIYDPSTQLISLITPSTYAPPQDDSVSYVHIYCNTLLATFMEALFVNTGVFSALIGTEPVVITIDRILLNDERFTDCCDILK